MNSDKARAAGKAWRTVRKNQLMIVQMFRNKKHLFIMSVL